MCQFHWLSLIFTRAVFITRMNWQLLDSLGNTLDKLRSRSFCQQVQISSHSSLLHKLFEKAVCSFHVFQVQNVDSSLRVMPLPSADWTPVPLFCTRRFWFSIQNIDLKAFDHLCPLGVCTVVDLCWSTGCAGSRCLDSIGVNDRQSLGCCISLFFESEAFKTIAQIVQNRRNLGIRTCQFRVLRKFSVEKRITHRQHILTLVLSIQTI